MMSKLKQLDNSYTAVALVHHDARFARMFTGKYDHDQDRLR